MQICFRQPLASAAAALFLVFLVAAPRGAMAAQDPREFVGALGQQAIQVMGPSVPPAQRTARFRELLNADFDLPTIGQFVMGRHWQTMTPEQQQQFVQLFQEYIAQAYSARLGEFGGQPFRVTGTRPNGNETVVSSVVERGNGQPIKIDWYVGERAGANKIEDVYVDGVSMKVTHRDEFANVIQNNGGRIDAAMAVLRQKLAAAPQGRPR